ncbi:MAG: sugar phosphate isomerase/epimerase [Deltaproteobacteria bacterium]|nr:sugar phosphate isomerase/epimerase [Deltaproteobacteria bacterium]
MREILKKVQVHVPYGRLREELLDWVIGERINPEIGFNHIDLDRFRDADYRATADRLSDAGLSVTFHAPFMDLRPGAIDPSIRRLTLERLRRVFDLVPWFRPLSVVCHPSFDSRYYASVSRQWLDNSLETWRTLLSTLRGTGTIIALENVYETGPDQLRPLIDALDSPQVRFCFDTGHANTFGRVPPADWMDALGGVLGEIHLHDNHGSADEHLPVGEGSFPFGEFLGILRARGLKPILTLESHSKENLRRMLENIRTMNLLEGL